MSKFLHDTNDDGNEAIAIIPRVFSENSQAKKKKEQNIRIIEVPKLLPHHRHTNNTSNTHTQYS